MMGKQMSTTQHLTPEQAAKRFEEGIDVNPAQSRTPAATAKIRAAVHLGDRAQQEVDQAVIDARHRGITWLEIGIALGVSPQAAQKKYHHRV